MGMCVILDKSVFVGTATPELCGFAKKHTLIVPGVLIQECEISPDLKTQHLIKKIWEVVRAGADIWHLPFRAVEKEKESFRACDSLFDDEFTERFRNEELGLEELIEQETIDHAREKYNRPIGEMLKIASIMEKKGEGIIEDFKAGIRNRKMEDTKVRLDFFAKATEPYGMIHGWAVTLFSDKIVADRFCLSHEWFTWHVTRLLLILASEYLYKNIKSGQVPNQKLLQHHYYDGMYATYLSHASCLLSNDKDFLIPLAKAAFPDKDVFSCIKDVPKSYKSE
jgi:hypothetical protein